MWGLRGLILKDRCIIFDDWDTDDIAILSALELEPLRAYTTKSEDVDYVGASMKAPNENWLADVSEWEYAETTTVYPEWYTNDKEKYRNMFIDKVRTYMKERTHNNETIVSLSKGVHFLNHCRVNRVEDIAVVNAYSSWIDLVTDNAHVRLANGRTTIIEVTNFASIRALKGDSTVSYMRNCTKIGTMFDRSMIYYMCDESSVEEVGNSAIIRNMLNSSRVTRLTAEASIIKMSDQSSITSCMSMRSVVEDMRCDAKINMMTRESKVKSMRDRSKIGNMFDRSSVDCMREFSNVGLIKSKGVTIGSINDCAQVTIADVDAFGNTGKIRIIMGPDSSVVPDAV